MAPVILQPSLPPEQKTFEQKYRVPDGVSARPDAHCSYDAETAIIHDTVDLAAHYLQKREKHFCILFFCFTHTKEFQEVLHTRSDNIRLIGGLITRVAP